MDAPPDGGRPRGRLAAIVEGLGEALSHQRPWGTDAKGWVGNGLQELQQLGNPGVEQIQPGTNPTLGYVTTGEVTAERMAERPEAEAAAPPAEPTPGVSAEQLYGKAADGPEPEL